MSYWNAIEEPASGALNIPDGIDATIRLICLHQLDIHHHITQGKVSVWHPTILDRVTTRYDDHGGAYEALCWTVGKVVELLEKEAS